MIHAKDLTKEAPRSPKEILGGFAILGRTIDKCRATIAGTNGEYHFNCPLDQSLLNWKGISADDFKEYVGMDATDNEIVEWVTSHGNVKTDAEIEAWTKKVSEERYMGMPEKREWLLGELKRVGLPENATLHDYLEVDDRQSFGK
jgi:hypothetical protein